MENNNLKCGIIGGTFNPVHFGHITIAKCFAEELSLDKLFIVPNFISPFKTEKTDLPDSIHRINMLKIAFSEHHEFIIDKYEIDKKEISYSIDTINHFRLKFPNSDIYFLIGDDQIPDFHKWKDWCEIIHICKIVIANRAAEDKKQELKAIADDIFQSAVYSVKWLNNDLVEISSSEIRNNIRQGKAIKNLLPEKVINYILENRLYISNN